MKTETGSVHSWIDAYRSGGSPRDRIHALAQQIEETENPAVWIHRLTPAELEPYLKRLEGVSPGELPLFGVPFAIKDNIDLAGVPTTAACPGYSYIPERSAFVVENLIRAGAIPMGKTNLDQFATGLVGTRSPYGVPRNPLAPDRIPGGSSSGSAVAVSEGLVAFSLGTDTAGSGRVPAAFNRLCGVKPSRGRLSTGGVVPACRTLDCVSIFAADLADCETVLRAAEGYDRSDSFSRPVVDRPLGVQRAVGVPKAGQLMFFGDAGYANAWEQAVREVESRGWKVLEIDFEPFLQAARLLYEGPWVAERFTALEEYLRQEPEAFYPVTRQIIEGGSNLSARDTFAAIYRLAELKRESDSVWNSVDAIVTPTAGGFPSLAEVEADPLGPNSKLGYYTNFMNLLDLCAVAVPVDLGGNDLPFGVTWIAPRDRDMSLIRAAGGATFPKVSESDRINLLLFGAHMDGLPLNSQVRGLGAMPVGPVRTAPAYRMIHLEAPAPARPGVIRVEEGGAALEGEVWSFPKSALGEFLASIRQPLGLGEIELVDGSRCHGFICEAAAVGSAPDITNFGGWRNFQGGTVSDEV